MGGELAAIVARLPAQLPTDRGGMVETAGLEVGQLVYYLPHARVPDQVRLLRAAELLRDMRNDLAHLQPIALEVLQDGAAAFLFTAG